MSYLDIILLVILGIAFFTGMRRGLIASIFSLAGVVLGVWLAGRYYASFSKSVVEQAIAFVVILVVVAVVATLVGRLISKIVHLALLGWVDVVLGGILGAVIAALVIALVLVTYLRFLGPADPITNSAIARVLIDRLPLVLGLLPENFRQAVSPYFR